MPACMHGSVGYLCITSIYIYTPAWIQMEVHGLLIIPSLYLVMEASHFKTLAFQVIFCHLTLCVSEGVFPNDYTYDQPP